MAVIKSGATTDQLTIDPTSKAARVTLYDEDGRALAYQSKMTYSAANGFTPAATPNDLAIIYGSATKTVRVISFKFGANNTAAGSQQYLVQKKSALPSGGVFVAATAVPLDSNNDVATATNIGHYTTDPTTGTSLGFINVMRCASPVLIPATFAGIVEVAQFEMLPTDGSGVVQPVTLHGVNEGVCINFADTALVAGQTHSYCIVWTEE